MRLRYKRNIFPVLLLLPLMLLSSCHSDLEQQSSMQLRLCLPVQAQQSSARRVPGDPGTTEHFDLPQYAYVFVLKQNGDQWQIWKKDEYILDNDSWIRTHYTGSRMNAGDSIFMYNLPMNLKLQDKTSHGNIYAICSNKKLTFNLSNANITSLSDVLDLKFNTAPDSIQENLQNIYSTPYNYTVDGQYYCAYDCSTGHGSSVDMILYHVAAKVDIKWNVVDTMRINLSDPAQAVRLTYMDARRLFNGYAYCFKPMRNTLAAKPESGYDIHIVTPSDEGLWWEGRTYFYTIPYTVEGEKRYFPLQMLMRTNGTSGTGYQLTLNQPIDTAAVFVPWLRGNFNLTKPLEDKSETKTAN